MTTGISLVRENAAALRPPRMLWVSFPLGRPLGRANDAAFQHRVIDSALALLQAPSGPVLADFPEDMGQEIAEQPPACPVSFARKREDADTWRARLLTEMDSLRPWYELSLRRRGRTTVGICESPMEESLTRLADWLDEREQPLPDLGWFKRAIEDAKAWYGEAITGQPGDYPPGHAERLLWSDTQLGAAIKEYYARFRQHPDLAIFARLVASREAVGESTGGSEALRQAIDNKTPETHRDAD